jgi:hypothetical protein
MVIDQAAVRSLKAMWAAGKPPADPWYAQDSQHRTAWAYAPRKLHPDFIPTVPTTRETITRLLATRQARS